MNNQILEIWPGGDIIRVATLVGRNDLDAMLCQGRGISARIAFEENRNAAEMYCTWHNLDRLRDSFCFVDLLDYGRCWC